MRPRSPSARTALTATRIVSGAVLLTSPDRVLAKCPDPVPDYARGAVRVLGVRQIVEGAVLARHPRRPPPKWSIAVDALHGLSMLAVAATRPGLRPAAVRSAASALALTALSAYER
ncbi:MAG TPA: hypothetical protein VFH80_19920 [Solirubrobacteraceae bacterium]|nr:hypothetical protein [Solirubrobacteraceae bacterium]